MTEHIQQDIHRKAILKAYRLVAKFVELNEDGSQEWRGRPSQVLAKLKVMADQTPEVPIVRMETDL